MAPFKMNYLFATLTLLAITSVSFAVAPVDDENSHRKSSLEDYQKAVIYQLFQEKKNLLSCPEIGGTPNVNIDAIIEQSQVVEVKGAQIIFTWNAMGHPYFDQIRISIKTTADKKTIQDLKLEYFKFGAINKGNLEEPIIVDGFYLLGLCR